jgi:hypothetical protein
MNLGSNPLSTHRGRIPRGSSYVSSQYANMSRPTWRKLAAMHRKKTTDCTDAHGWTSPGTLLSIRGHR